MRFRLEYPSGAAHEVEVAGSVAAVGRDPSSDLVLNDPKCSRRHAVIESGPDGITIRDNGSANGVFVNGRKTERSRIRDGDVVKLGDVTMTLLPEPMSGTVVMEQIEDLGAPRSGRPPDIEVTTPEMPSEELVGPAAYRKAFDGGRGAPRRPSADVDSLSSEGPGTLTGSRRPRPLTVSVLAGLWAVS